MTVLDLNPIEYHSYYAHYIMQVPKENTLLDGFKIGSERLEAFFKSIPKDKLNYRYALDKWSVKEVFQHIIDTERVFMYRCFRIARHDETSVAGFEQDDYIKPSNADSKTLNDLIEEYQATRYSFIVFLKSLKHDDLISLGNANGAPMSARAAAFIVLGHEIHHINFIVEYYLV